MHSFNLAHKHHEKKSHSQGFSAYHHDASKALVVQQSLKNIPSASVNMSINNHYQSQLQHLLSTIKQLSAHPQWILFTAQASIPKPQTMQSLGIQIDHIVQMKPSKIDNEFHILCKAIRAATACLIVASSAFSQEQKQFLNRLARKYQSQIFFMPIKENLNMSHVNQTDKKSTEQSDWLFKQVLNSNGLKVTNQPKH